MSSINVAVVGCGALGLNYGTRLLEAQLHGNAALDVSLVVRRDYDLICKEGLLVEYGKANEDKTRLAFTGAELSDRIFRDTITLSKAKDVMDWVLVCCKSFAIDSNLKEQLEQLNGPNTKFLIIMNGLGVEDPFIEWFGAEKVYGALSLIACNRGPNPPVAAGPLAVNVYLDLKLDVAHVSDDVTKSKLAVQLFEHTAIKNNVVLSTHLLRAKWDKLCWNLTFAGMCVAMGGLTCDVIVQDPSLRVLANNVIRDIIRVANADITRQHRERHSSNNNSVVGDNASNSAPPLDHLINEDIVLGKQVPPNRICSILTVLVRSYHYRFCQLPANFVVEIFTDSLCFTAEIWVRTENAGAYKSSTVLDLVARRPMEMHYLFGVPLQRAR